MLTITIPAKELWNEATQEFSFGKEVTLKLEHSLVSLSKWESKWCKPFLTKQDKTIDEMIDYIKCMTITQNVPDETYNRLTQEHINQIFDYIDAPMTATTIHEKPGAKSSGEQVTAELIYYWMISLNIPPEYEKWHLNRLITLVRVCNVKNQPPKKMGRRERLSRQAALNASRRKQLNTRG